MACVVGTVSSSVALANSFPSHTITMVVPWPPGGPIVINPYINAAMPYDAQKDFTPITNVLQVPLVLVMNPTIPANNLQELLAYIKEESIEWKNLAKATSSKLN
ncbi:tripartite tricarboxylate transporter substrate-binding protein [Advenella sp. RU8]|uniref:tripartite tricarboxylate transporter substrate-binding protein n=1 Tax=Advenella sp. RU8 TaxID=3399575 RepID=UPI003AADA3C4